MAEVNIDLRLNQGNVRSGLRQVQTSIGQTNGVLNSFLGNLAADAFLGFARGAVTAFGDIFRSAIQIEQVGAQFRVLIGDAQQAEIALESVSRFAAGTPFDNPSVERAATQLLAFGTTAGQLNERLTDLGNIAGVANRSIDEIATIFGQVNAQGRLTAERFNQLVEGGINLGEALSTRLMIPVTQLRDAISAGAVSADVFNEAIGELGDQFGGIDALANTLGGQLSTLGSQFELIRRTIGSELTPALTELVRGFNAFLESIQPVIRAITQLVVERVLTFFRELREGLDDGTSSLIRIRDFLIEHRGIIIRIATVYGIYIAALVAARTASIAYGIAVGLVSPVLTVLRVSLLAARTAVIFLSGAFVRLAGFLATTFTAAIGILLTPIGAVGAAIIALGVVGTGFSTDMAAILVRIQRFFVQFGQTSATVGAVVEAVFRDLGARILMFIGPPIESILATITRLIRAVPSAFRPAFLDRFADSLDGVSFTNIAMGLRMGSSGLAEFAVELGRSDMRLEALQNQLDATASMTTFGEQLSMTFNTTLDNLQNAAVNNEFLGPLLSQLGSFRDSLAQGIPLEGIAMFAEGGQDLLNGLRMALVDGQVPDALRSLVGDSVGEIQSAIMQIEDERARAERNAAESDTVANDARTMRMQTQTVKEVAEIMRRDQMIANIRLMAMEQLAIMEADERIREIEQTGLNSAEDLAMLASAEQAKIDLVFRFANLRAMNEGNANTASVQREQAQANMSVAIATRASEERMRLAEAEMRSSRGFANARDRLIQAGLNSERLGANERKALLVTQAVINTYAGASRAFADYPYPASLAVAGATVVAGLVQVDNIVNAGSFQGGGLVGGNSFSGDRLQANVNSGELILNRAQQSTIAGQLQNAENGEGEMASRLASIERLLSQPVIIQNANGAMFAEITREGIRDGVDING